MKIIRNIAVAFALYSRVPMPSFAWKREDMEWNIVCLPLVGLVLGAVEMGIWSLASHFELPSVVTALLWIAGILLFTGGFHVDGYMDVSDALRSYKPKEEKLKILKDPHIGAFSVISLVQCGCLYLAAAIIVFEKGSCRWSGLAALSFFLVRAVAGLLAVKLPHAKKEGMLHEETKTAGTLVPTVLCLQIGIGLLAALFLHAAAGLTIGLGLFLFSLYFKEKCGKEFGGITGDCSGYFIVMGEMIYLIILAIFCLI